MIRWTTAFVDRPAASFTSARTFWQRVTATTLSEVRGEQGEFSTFVPIGADAFLRLQRVDHGPGGTHLDLHVDDIPASTAVAEDLGATRVAEHDGVTVLRSPGGLTFCLVAHHGESNRPAPVGRPGARTLVDQVCIDIAPDRFDTDCDFWAALTGWELADGREPEFRVLRRPPTMPLRFLLQRRGDADRGRDAECHLDLACDDVDLAERAHTVLGATLVKRNPWWAVMEDPAGLSYCLTARSPDTGLPASL
ncbi:VOC family protein [Ilumatobacter sp.]|uniref:VOC family protein n=1 Tax=Ilumatobacter sp. TaxID=1967498 RepID=UPI003AF7C841